MTAHLCICPSFLCIHLFPCYIHPFGDLEKLGRNQRLFMCLEIVDPPNKSLKPIYFDHPKVYASCDGPTGQMRFRLHHVCVLVCNTEILN